MATTYSFVRAYVIPSGNYVSINALIGVSAGTSLKLINNCRNAFYGQEASSKPSTDDYAIIVHGYNTAQYALTTSSTTKSLWVKNLSTEQARILIFTEDA